MLVSVRWLAPLFLLVQVGLAVFFCVVQILDTDSTLLRHSRDVCTSASATAMGKVMDHHREVEAAVRGAQLAASFAGSHSRDSLLALCCSRVASNIGAMFYTTEGEAVGCVKTGGDLFQRIPLGRNLHRDCLDSDSPSSCGGASAYYPHKQRWSEESAGKSELSWSPLYDMNSELSLLHAGRTVSTYGRGLVIWENNAAWVGVVPLDTLSAALAGRLHQTTYIVDMQGVVQTSSSGDTTLRKASDSINKLIRESFAAIDIHQATRDVQVKDDGSLLVGYVRGSPPCCADWVLVTVMAKSDAVDSETSASWVARAVSFGLALIAGVIAWLWVASLCTQLDDLNTRVRGIASLKHQVWDDIHPYFHEVAALVGAYEDLALRIVTFKSFIPEAGLYEHFKDKNGPASPGVPVWSGRRRTFGEIPSSRRQSMLTVTRTKTDDSVKAESLGPNVPFNSARRITQGTLDVDDALEQAPERRVSFNEEGWVIGGMGRKATINQSEASDDQPPELTSQTEIDRRPILPGAVPLRENSIASNQSWNRSDDDGLHQKKNRITTSYVSVRSRKATVLLIEVDILRSNTVFIDTHVKLSQAFTRTVLEVVKHYEGTILSLSSNYVLASWNSHKSIPLHVQQACQAALDLGAQMPAIFRHQSKVIWTMAVAAGTAFVGQSGTVEQRTALVAGEPLTLAKSMVRLAPQIHSRILVNEAVFDQVQSQMFLRLVDCIPFPSETLRRRLTSDGLSEISDEESTRGSSTTCMVYELVGIRATDESPEAQPELYIDAFRSLRNHCFLQCIEKMRKYLECNPGAYQAFRIMRLAQLFSNGNITLPKPYHRVDHGWMDFESSSSNLPSLSKDIVAITPPLEVLKPAPGTRPPAALSTSTTKEATNLKRDIEQARLSVMAAITSVRMANRLSSALHAEVAEGSDSPPSTPSESEMSSTRSSIVSDRDRWNTIGLSKMMSGTTDVPVECRDKKDAVWWRSEKLLGKGAYGEVWLALSEDGGMIALKTLKIPSLSSITSKKRRGDMDIEDLISEVSLLTRLRHENIVSYLSSMVTGRYLVICMEYMSGGSLSNLLEQFGTLPVSSAVRYMKDILRGLKFLHDQEIVHRDIKPPNVLLLTDGTCKLSDFGASQHIAKLTGKANVQGTPQYMAPEACRGFAEKASDIWGLGIMLVRLLSGEMPYTFTEKKPFVPHVFIHRLAYEADFGPDLSNLSIPHHARTFAECCLHREASLRPTAEELLLSPFVNLAADMMSPTHR